MSVSKVLTMRLWSGVSMVAVAMALFTPCAQADTADSGANQDQGGAVQGVSELITVSGQRTLNTDVRRNREDIQPYITFDAEQIQQSGVQNIEDFLQSRLPMNAAQSTQSQVGPGTGAQGRLDLRGMGTDETLVLVDGRRLPSITTGDSFGQPNINGISLSQIERIEILPATSSGIYGGGATGGVINIILKRDYSGIDAEARYDDTTGFKAGQSYFGINGGKTFDQWHTSIMGSFSISRAGSLAASDRNFTRRGAQLQFRNDPATSTILSGGPNICATEDGYECSVDTLVLNNGKSLNSSATSLPDKYTGNPADLAARGGQLINNRSHLPIWAAPNTMAFNLDVRQEFGQNFEAFVDFSQDTTSRKYMAPLEYALYVPAGSAANPFQQDVLANINIPNMLLLKQTTRNNRLNVGTIIHLPYRWSAAIEYDWLRSKGSSVNNTVLGPASSDAQDTLASLAFSDLSSNKTSVPLSLFDISSPSGVAGTTLETASIRLGGPVFKLPGGDLTATALLERRWETSDQTVNQNAYTSGPVYYYSPKSVRNVDSAYVELRAPIISASNDVPFVWQLELMGAIRHDSYVTKYSGSSIPVASPTGPFPDLAVSTNNVSATNYTVGLKYAPTQDIAFRASRGDGFLPPKLANIRSEMPAVFSSFLISLLDLRDPARGNALIPGPVTILAGGNPSVKPEKSDSFSAGVVLTPRFVPNLRISVDYTSTHKSDEVLNMPVSFFLANENLFSGRIARGANLPGDAPGTLGPITAIDTTAINLSKSKMRALDTQADYDIQDTGFGSLHFYGAGTHMFELSLVSVPGVASIERAGMFDGPLKWRANAGVDWKSGPWGIGWNTQFYGSYSVCQSVDTDFTCGQKVTWQGAKKIGSQNYSDIYVNYAFESHGFLANTDVRFGIQNLFNQAPPTVAVGVDQTGYSSFADPRLQRFTLALRKHF